MLINLRTKANYRCNWNNDDIVNGVNYFKLREMHFAAPIIAITVTVMTDDVESYLANGMSAHIAKPIDIKRIP